MCYHRLKNAAKRRGIRFELTRAEFAHFATETNYRYKAGRTVAGWHLDRIDPLAGYAIGNLQVLTASENSRKGATTDKAQYAALHRAYDPQRRKMDFWFTHHHQTGPPDGCPF